ncbi:hypothetical protein DMENIID0001_054710 [Sergentomyia squamirostris]
MQFISKNRLFDKVKLLVPPVLLGYAVFCNMWHFLYEVKSLENILDISININFCIAGVQTGITIFVVNIGLKNNQLKVQRYFKKIAETSEEFLNKAREQHPNENLKAANTVVRTFVSVFMVSITIFPVIALYQTDFVSPLFYRFPGIPSRSLFFYPVNIIGQLFIYNYLIYSVIIMDCLFFIYLLYFRGVLHSITAVADLLSRKENLKNCDRILQSIYEAHRELLDEFRSLSEVMWHFYCHKMSVMILFLCSCFFLYSKTNSIASGLILQSMLLSLLIILCVSGQLLDNSSENLHETLYQSLWYEMQLKDQRNFLLIYKGTQRNIKVERMGIDKISFSTLVQVIKTAISYAAFMYTVLL